MAGYKNMLLETVQRTVSRGKDKLDVALLQSRLDKSQKQLGALVYSLHKNEQEDDDMIAHYVKEIDHIKDQINSIETPENDVVTVVECPSCQAEAEKDAMFCSRCGAKLS